MFGWSGKSTNPVQVQILNLPPPLRKVLYFGMHMWCLDSGSDAALSLIAEELDHLWKVGITVGTVKYRFALVTMVLDGRGLEKVRKVQGANSDAGCYECNFEGRSWHNCGVVYDGHRRYL